MLIWTAKYRCNTLRAMYSSALYPKIASKAISEHLISWGSMHPTPLYSILMDMQWWPYITSRPIVCWLIVHAYIHFRHPWKSWLRTSTIVCKQCCSSLSGESKKICTGYCHTLHKLAIILVIVLCRILLINQWCIFWHIWKWLLSTWLVIYLIFGTQYRNMILICYYRHKGEVGSVVKCSRAIPTVF